MTPPTHREIAQGFPEEGEYESNQLMQITRLVGGVITPPYRDVHRLFDIAT